MFYVLRALKEEENSRPVTQRKTAKNGMPFVVTCNPLLKSLTNIFHDNLYFLYMNEELKGIVKRPRLYQLGIIFVLKVIWHRRITPF